MSRTMKARTQRLVICFLAVFLVAPMVPVMRAYATPPWHDGWCKESEDGFAVIVDVSRLDPDKRGDFATQAGGPGVDEGWVVRCRLGLPSLEEMRGEGGGVKVLHEDFFAAQVGIEVTKKYSRGTIFGIPYRNSSVGDVFVGGLSLKMVPDGQGGMKPPRLPENGLDLDDDYEGKATGLGSRGFEGWTNDVANHMFVYITAAPPSCSDAGYKVCLGKKPLAPQIVRPKPTPTPHDDHVKPSPSGHPSSGKSPSGHHPKPSPSKPSPSHHPPSTLPGGSLKPGSNGVVPRGRHVDSRSGAAKRSGAHSGRDQQHDSRVSVPNGPAFRATALPSFQPSGSASVTSSPSPSRSVSPAASQSAGAGLSSTASPSSAWGSDRMPNAAAQAGPISSSSRLPWIIGLVILLLVCGGLAWWLGYVRHDHGPSAGDDR
ncbi:hypothetical protein [Cutibacterium porci]|uniref:hypothetical protein n=1 Tax=Cutibacterium porci TaxID=2605781 RepID=UPI0018A6BFC0|nr:hypothetical protein [Cutibacterium porci]